MASVENEIIYLDHAATTPVAPEVVQVMLPYFSERYGNPSSIYSLGRQAAGALNESREMVAEVLNCPANEVYFTASGTEADNLAIRGVALAQKERRGAHHLITSAIEHHAVLHTFQWLEKHSGFEVTYLPVDKLGLVDPEALRAAVRDDTALISVMYANNEVGTVEPIAEIGQIAKERHIPFHTDAVQAGGVLSLDAQALGVDLMSLSAHKFYGPKGVGVLYIRRGTPFLSVLSGGGQERGRRPGTENVAYAVGLATALRLAHASREAENERIASLRDRLVQGLLSTIPRTQLSGHPSRRLPNSASVLVEYVEGEAMLLSLDMEGICASSGSACTSGSLDPSHVLMSMGYPHEIAHGSLRLTLGRSNNEAQVDRVVTVLPAIIDRLRAMSPLAPASLRKCTTG